MIIQGVNKQAMKMINATEIWFNRYMLKIKWPYKISNESVIHQLNT